MSYVYNLSNVIPKEKMFDGDFLESKKINRKEITGPNGITYNIYRYEKRFLEGFYLNYTEIENIY